MCVRGKERESPAYFPPSLCAWLFLSSLPRSISPPRSLASLPFPPLHFLSIISSCSVCVSLSLSLPPFPSFLPLPSPLSLPLSPPLSFSSRASLLAVDVTEAEAEATLPLIGCHSQVSDKEKREREKRDKKARGGGGGGGKGGENTALTSQ